MAVQVLKSVVAWMRYVSLAFPRRLNWTWFIGVPLRVAALAVNWALEEEPPWGLGAAGAVAGLDAGLLCVRPPGEVKSWVLLDTGRPWLGWEDGVGRATAVTNKPSAKADRRRHLSSRVKTPRSHKEVRSLFINEPHWLISTSQRIQDGHHPGVDRANVVGGIHRKGEHDQLVGFEEHVIVNRHYQHRRFGRARRKLN